MAASAQRLAAFVTDEWAGRLIRGWDESWYELPLTIGDRLGEVVLGAAAGQTTIGDSTTVLLYNRLRRAQSAARLYRDRPGPRTFPPTAI